MKAKKINLYLMLVAMLTLSLGFTACDDDDEKDVMPKSNTIVDIAASDANFSILVQALTKANLVSTLNGSTEFTVFAPTNAAFTDLLAELQLSSLDDIPEDDLRKILLYHVVGGTNRSSTLSTGYYPSASEKQTGYFYSIYFNKESLMLNNKAKVTQADIMADNGVIHVIDKVITPQSITDHVIENPNLSSLTAAVVKAELAGTLDNEDVNYTVFAPTNEAFTALLTDLSVTLDDLTKEALTPILLYHVVDAFVPAADVSTSYVPTLSTGQGENILINVVADETGVMLNNSAKVILTDVVATNGIIHVIDKVIMPPTVVDIAINNAAFSILVEAVVKAELVGALSAEGPFTVFAPTNAAFQALFTALNVSGISELSKEALTPILLAHVVSGNERSSALSNGTVGTLNPNKSITIDVSNGVKLNGDINVVIADVQGINGVVHAIDKVIVP